MDFELEPMSPYTKWKLPEHTPGHNMPVFGFFPEIGNDDEGYGHVMLIWWDTFTNRFHECVTNRVCKPTLWCSVTYVEPPFKADTPELCMSTCLKVARGI